MDTKVRLRRKQWETVIRLNFLLL